MIIGWAWEWPVPPCAVGAAAHEWVANSFAVTNYEPGVTRVCRWWRCRGCFIRRETKP